jgi:GDPmannose 4,6-dehydratase
VSYTFSALNLDWQEHVVTDKSLLRPTDIAMGKGNPAKAKDKLGWEAKYQLPDIIRMMIQAKT